MTGGTGRGAIILVFSAALDRVRGVVRWGQSRRFEKVGERVKE